MRLIDADELLLDWEWFDEWGNYTRAGQAVADAPTIDAVEVVRCRDCRHRYVSGNGTTNYYVCDYMDAQYEDEGYCHHGEREGE